MALRTYLLAAVVAISGVAGPSSAYELPDDEKAASFIWSNVIATFYHELGHALIDVLELPVLGREEDAADSLSALLIHQIWEEDSAAQMIDETANAFFLNSQEADANGHETAYWDEHSLDLQRYYNLVCLFYGADPDGRAFIVTDYELPEDRAERCPDEFAQTEAAWSAMLDQAAWREGAAGLVMQGDGSGPLADLLAQEVVDFNATYSLPTSVLVELAACGEANAFYNPANQTVTICSEYAEELERLYMASLEE
ncbi:MAG: DUF4344 domain-containing metallopeptidase [Cypionkella sp.]|nr:DUF4344 domain-containing metallopeptidase [Cypionkella sp.]